MFVKGVIENVDERSKKDGNPFWKIKMGGVDYIAWDRLVPMPHAGQTVQLDVWQNNRGDYVVNVLDRDKRPNPNAVEILGSAPQPSYPPDDGYPSEDFAAPPQTAPQTPSAPRGAPVDREHLIVRQSVFKAVCSLLAGSGVSKEEVASWCKWGEELMHRPKD